LHRLLSAGGAGFALLVLVQNLIRGASAPANDATLTAVTTYYRENIELAMFAAASFVVAALILVGFLAEVGRRLVARGAGVWAYVGMIGATAVISLFSLVIAADAALVGAAGRATPNPATIDALWLMHNGVFAVLGLALATALLGLGRACAAAGLTPSFFRWLAPVGAALLCVETAAAPVLADGRAMPAMLPSLLGFLVWLVFLASTSVTMLKRPA
jgi:hypothetical protein